MARLKSIPLSRAKNVLGLLRDVQRAILDEPKRGDMGLYCANRGPEHGGPQCGTVGCFAGWVCILRDSRQGGSSAHVAAQQILGSDLFYSFKGRDGGFYSFFNGGSGDGCQTTAAGTVKHARAIVARINRFIRLNGGESALRARKLEPVSR